MNANLAKPKALVVDDEFLIAAALESCLGDAGFEVTVATSTDTALAEVEGRSFDLALIDINLGDGNSVTDGLAAALVDRGIPFAICTGSAPEDARALYPGRPVIEKPFLDSDVARVAHSLVGIGQAPVSAT